MCKVRVLSLFRLRHVLWWQIDDFGMLVQEVCYAFKNTLISIVKCPQITHRIDGVLGR